MKLLFTFLLLSLSCHCTAQTFGVKDFLLTQKSQDFELIGHFLIKYHNFRYSKDIDEGNCKGYQFKNINQQIEVMRCPSKLNNEDMYKFVLFYRIPITQFTVFRKSLIDSEYSIYSVTDTPDGHKVIMWTLKDTNKISAFFVEEDNGFYEITGT